MICAYKTLGTTGREYTTKFEIFRETYAEVSAVPKFDNPISQILWHPECVESKRERMKKLNCLSIQTEGKTRDLYMKEREGKPNADCQSRSPMPSTSAEPSSSPWGQARPMGAGEADGGKRGWWGQARPMGAASHRPQAPARQHRTLGKPPGQIPSQHLVPALPFSL